MLLSECIDIDQNAVELTEIQVDGHRGRLLDSPHTVQDAFRRYQVLERCESPHLHSGRPEYSPPCAEKFAFTPERDSASEGDDSHAGGIAIADCS
jgi:hypothetical protein